MNCECDACMRLFFTTCIHMMMEEDEEEDSFAECDTEHTSSSYPSHKMSSFCIRGNVMKR